MLIPALIVVLIAQVGPMPERIEVGTHMQKSFAFEWDGRSADGTNPHPAPVRDIIFRYREPNDGPRHFVTITMDVPPNVTIKVPFSDALKGVPAGPRDLDIRLLDADGLLGNYSAPDLFLDVEVVKSGPTGASNLRIEKP